MGPELEYHLRPVPDECIDIEVDTSAVCSRIVAGVLEHRSQREVLIEPGARVRRWEKMVSKEPAVIAWPLRSAGQPLLTDLFEGL